MDVKVGNGAFMAKLADARALARRAWPRWRTGAGLPTNVLLTDMDQPLADVGRQRARGALRDRLPDRRRRQPRMHEVVVALGAEMLLLGRVVRTAAGRAQGDGAGGLARGAAAERFEKMVAAMGGPRDLVAKPGKHLVLAACAGAGGARSSRPGESRIDTRAVGMAVVALGGGRTRPQDSIDHSVGLTDLAARR